MTEPALTVRLNAADNVVVARRAIAERTRIDGEGVTSSAKIPAGHKIATAKIANGAPVRKYNQIIGVASADILPGDHVHVHNCVMADFARDYAIGSAAHPTVMVPEANPAAAPTVASAIAPLAIATTAWIGQSTSPVMVTS